MKGTVLGMPQITIQEILDKVIESEFQSNKKESKDFTIEHFKKRLVIGIQNHKHLNEESQLSMIPFRINDRGNPLTGEELITYDNYLMFSYYGHDDVPLITNEKTIENITKDILETKDNPFISFIIIFKDNKVFNYQVKDNQVIWDND